MHSEIPYSKNPRPNLACIDHYSETIDHEQGNFYNMYVTEQENFESLPRLYNNAQESIATTLPPQKGCHQDIAIIPHADDQGVKQYPGV